MSGSPRAVRRTSMPGRDYPGTVGLMQVLACNFLGRWDDALMNLPFWMLAVAFALAVFGALRAMEFTAPWALAGTWLVASLPLANAHVALAGYADLPLAMYLCVAVLACLRWLKAREPADAALALLMLAACPLLKVPGRIWVVLALPALLVGLLPRRGPRIVGAGFAVAVLGLLYLAQTSPVIMGYRLHLDFAPAWDALAASFFLYDNWHLLWYGAVAVALLGRRQLLAPSVAPLTFVVAGGVIFIGFVLSFTNARDWVADQSTVNRATLHVAPLMVIWMLVVFRTWAQTLHTLAATEAIAATPEMPPDGSSEVLPSAPPPTAIVALMLQLPGVTLVCIDTANHALALRALAQSCAAIRFARVLFLTDSVPDGVAVPGDVEIVAIAPITSRDAYSTFVLKDLLPFVDTGHVLLVQWDGYVANPGAWDAAFLECDYLGAKWYWHHDGMRVGNGGFSLRSRRLLEALRDPRIQLVEAEDTTIGRTFRPLLEREHAIRFGSEALADQFCVRSGVSDREAVRLSRSVQLLAGHAAGRTGCAASAFFRRHRALPATRAACSTNCMSALQWAPAIAIARRILAAEPARDDVRTLLATAEGHAASGTRRRPQRPLPVRQRQALQTLPWRERGRCTGAPRYPLRERTDRARDAGPSAWRHRRRRARIPRRTCGRARTSGSRCITLAWSTINATASPRRCRSSSAPSRSSRRSRNSITTWAWHSPQRTGRMRRSCAMSRRSRVNPTLPRRGTTWDWRANPRTGCRRRSPHSARHCA